MPICQFSVLFLGTKVVVERLILWKEVGKIKSILCYPMLPTLLLKS